MITGKIWGTTEVQIATPIFEKHLLRIHPKFQCSLHKHNFKWNSFTVIEGKLYIDVVRENDVVDTTELGPGSSTTVPPGIYHRFRTGGEGCIATEEYYPETLSEDIQRMGQGGPVEE